MCCQHICFSHLSLTTVIAAWLSLMLISTNYWTPSFAFSEEVDCSYPKLTSYLQQVASNYSHISRLTSIGQTVERRDLWVLIISDHPNERPLLRPQVKFVGNIVGYSGPSCYILLKLIDHLVTSYGHETSPERRLIHTNEIHILPNMNPDGFSKSIPGKCDGAVGKYNGGGQHLNRDFPHIFDSLDEDTIRQPETEAVMSWIHSNNFLTSVSYFSGAKIVTYPFDSVPLNELEAMRDKPYLTPDDDAFQHLTSSYVSHVEQADWHCPRTERKFPSGKINGAEWMALAGTMMDYNYFEGTFEMFIGVTCCRNENDKDALEKIWLNNKMAMLKIIQESEYAVKGEIVDAETNKPVPSAKLVKFYENFRMNQKVEPIPWPGSSRGEFWRLILPGRYVLQVSAPGYKTKNVRLEVEPLYIPKLLVKLDPEKSRVLSKRFEPESLTTTAASLMIGEDHEEHHGLMQNDESNANAPSVPLAHHVPDHDTVNSQAHDTFVENEPENVTSTHNHNGQIWPERQDAYSGSGSLLLMVHAHLVITAIAVAVEVAFQLK